MIQGTDPRQPVTEQTHEGVLGELMVTTEELAHLSWTEWKPDQWLEEAVELEATFGLGVDSPTEESAAPRSSAAVLDVLDRILRVLLVSNLTLLVVMLLLLVKQEAGSQLLGNGRRERSTDGQLSDPLLQSVPPENPVRAGKSQPGRRGGP